MRRSVSLIAIASLVGALTFVAAPAAQAAPTLTPGNERFADFTFSLSDSTDLVPGQRLDLTITQNGTDPLCASFDEGTSSWVESADGLPVILFLVLYTVDGGTYSMVGDPLQALNSSTYTTGMTSISAEIDLERVFVPGPYVAYAICQHQDGDRQYSGPSAEQDVTFTPFTFSPSPTPAGSSTTLSVPRPDLWCSVDGVATGHSVVIFYASNPADLVDGAPPSLPAGWEEEVAGLGSFNPDTSTTITIPITLPSDLPEGTYWIAIQCVGPESEGYFESGNARYFGTLTVGPAAAPSPGAPPAAELAATGAAEQWAIGMLALGLLAAGVAVLSLPRRSLVTARRW